MPEDATRFDPQAPGFDQRAGVGDDVAAAAAEAVLDVVAPASADLLLEIGAGTGEIGRHLAHARHYLGLDRSRAMLEVFRRRDDRPGGRRVQLVQCDARGSWPVHDRAASAIFASRAVHLLDRGHVAAEVARVCRGGGYLVLGRVERDPQSPKSRLRRQRAALLRSRGMAVRAGGRASEMLLDRLAMRGATRLGARVAATWQVRTTPAEIMADWQSLARIGGTPRDASVLAGLFDALRAWARQELGDIDASWDSTETYVLDAVRLPPEGLLASQAAVGTTRRGTPRPTGATWTTPC
jgi:ubiquinone/menaquinone biosynthesis C-methylase UbiE